MTTVFPHIVVAATIFFKIHLVRKLFKFSFPLCNENLNSFLTRWGNYSRRGNYSREETIWGNTVFIFLTKSSSQSYLIILRRVEIEYFTLLFTFFKKFISLGTTNFKVLQSDFCLFLCTVILSFFWYILIIIENFYLVKILKK